MGRIGPAAKDAVPALIIALGDKFFPVRKAAAKALRKIGTPEAMKAVEVHEPSIEKPPLRAERIVCEIIRL